MVLVFVVLHALVFIRIVPMVARLRTAREEPLRLTAFTPVHAVDKRAGSLCVLVRTYRKNTALSILSLVSSLVRSAEVANAQRLHIVFSNTDRFSLFLGLPLLVSRLSRLFAESRVNVTVTQNKRRYLEILSELDTSGMAKLPRNDFGFVATDFMLEDVLRADECNALVVTNADNYYMKDFVRLVLDALRGRDVALVQFVSRYDFEPVARNQVRLLGCMPGLGPNQAFYPSPKPKCVPSELQHGFDVFGVRRCVDLGAAVFSVATLRRTGVRFILDDVRSTRPRSQWRTEMHAFRDGYFVEALHDLHHASFAIVNATLFVHQ